MKNKFFIRLAVIFFLNILSFNLAYSEKFNFNVTEIEILDNGNLLYIKVLAFILIPLSVSIEPRLSPLNKYS